MLCVIADCSPWADRKLDAVRKSAFPPGRFTSPLNAHITLVTYLPEDYSAFMEACEKLGIASKIYSLSIPLGATVNMDGSCVYMAVFALALAKTYGVNVTGASITAIVISIVVLSIGAPGIPGSGLICLSVLLT